MPSGSLPFPFGNCGVCNAQATGKHYGAPTCEACKGFFKRTLMNRRTYRCQSSNGSCLPYTQGKTSLTKCKACRFKRCLRIGMSMAAIKMGRIPKAVKLLALRQAGSLADPCPVKPCLSPAISSESTNAASCRLDEVPSVAHAASRRPEEPAVSCLNLTKHSPASCHFDVPVHASTKFARSSGQWSPNLQTLAVTKGQPVSSESTETIESYGTSQMPSCQMCLRAATVGLKAGRGAIPCCFAACKESSCLVGNLVAWCNDLTALHEMDNDQVVSCITDAFFKLTLDHREEIASMEARLSRGRSPADDAMPVTPENKVKATTMMLQKLDTLSKDIASFANSCPGFSALPQCDRRALIQAAFVGVWLASRSSVFVDGDVHLLFINKTTYCRQWIEQFVPVTYIDSMQAYAESQNSAGLTTREISLICAITLVSDHGTVLSNQEAVSHIRERYVSALLYEVNQSRVDASITLADIQRLLQTLEQLMKDRSAMSSRVLDIAM